MTEEKKAELKAKLEVAVKDLNALVYERETKGVYTNKALNKKIEDQEVVIAKIVKAQNEE